MRNVAFAAVLLLALVVVVLVGRSLTDICHDPGMPSSSTARRCAMVYDMKEGARGQLSALSP